MLFVEHKVWKFISEMELKELLGLGVLILSVVNGLMLLKYYLRDKPKLKVRPVHPEIYQWWFKLPNGEFEGYPTRKYGFLAYIAISNRGLRKYRLTLGALILKQSGIKNLN